MKSPASELGLDLVCSIAFQELEIKRVSFVVLLLSSGAKSNDSAINVE